MLNKFNIFDFSHKKGLGSALLFWLVHSILALVGAIVLANVVAILLFLAFIVLIILTVISSAFYAGAVLFIVVVLFGILVAILFSALYSVYLVTRIYEASGRPATGKTAYVILAFVLGLVAPFLGTIPATVLVMQEPVRLPVANPEEDLNEA